MADERLPLKEADAVEITTVLDNTCDMLLASSATVRRASLGTRVGRKVLRAEHGFAAVIKVSGGDTSESLLFDAGLSRDGLMHNLDVLELKPNEMHAIALSHGHIDHTNGLPAPAPHPGPHPPPHGGGGVAASPGGAPHAAAASSRRPARAQGRTAR